jgi:N-acetylmuramoyl-L-alanine amidase
MSASGTELAILIENALQCRMNGMTIRRAGQSDPMVRQVIRHLLWTMGIAAILATAFTAWRPASLNPGELVAQWMAAADGSALTPAADAGTPGPAMLRVGIVAGHLGPNPETGLTDPGAVCADGLTELELNTRIATLAVEGLRAAGLEAELLEEFDSRLAGYRAAALVSIHADACTPINVEATGYKVSAALETNVPDRSQRLVACLVDRYQRATELRYHAGSITRDMTEYHTFFEIHNQTPAVIIETGFLYLDRQFLTEHPDWAARGIVEGVLCFIHNEPTSLSPEGRP